MHLVLPIEIRRLSDCSFQDAVNIWNKGFEGYFVDLTLSLDGYLARLQRDGLSPENSLLAFSENKPAGFLLNGIRMSRGRKVAWNGGTGVSPEFRGRGVGKALLRATSDLYEKERVEIATLEAISENRNAIALYGRFGYEIVDRLLSLTHTGPLAENAFQVNGSQEYTVKQVPPAAVAALEFFPPLVPWQSDWQSLNRNHGQALIVSDASGVSVGYSLFRKKRDEQGNLVEIVLDQCVAIPGRNARAICACALRSVYAPLDLACGRSTYNFSKSNETVLLLLIDAGFTNLIEQVHMVRTLATAGTESI